MCIPYILLAKKKKIQMGSQFHGGVQNLVSFDYLFDSLRRAQFIIYSRKRKFQKRLTHLLNVNNALKRKKSKRPTIHLLFLPYKIDT